MELRASSEQHSTLSFLVRLPLEVFRILELLSFDALRLRFADAHPSCVTYARAIADETLPLVSIVLPQWMPRGKVIAERVSQFIPVSRVRFRIRRLPIYDDNSLNFMKVLARTLPGQMISKDCKLAVPLLSDTIILEVLDMDCASDSTAAAAVLKEDTAVELSYSAGPSHAQLGEWDEASPFHELCDLIELSTRGAAGKLGIRGCLLHGPAGSGKSYLIDGVCDALSVNSFRLSVLEALAVGEADEYVTMFCQRVARHAPALCVLEDLDVLALRKDDESVEEVASVIQSQIEELLHTPSVFVVGVVRDASAVSAFFARLGVFDRRIETGVPSAKQRERIALSLLSDHSLMPPHSPTALASLLGKRAVGYVPGDLVQVCAMAQLIADDRSPALSRASLPLTAADLISALSFVRPSQLSEFESYIPDVRWEHIGGYEEVKAHFREVLEWPLLHPDRFTRMGIVPPSGTLLYGPSGCGKTLCVNAVASTMGVSFLAVKGPEVFSKYLGETERFIRNLFARARKLAPSIIFFDEMDVLGAQRGEQAEEAGGIYRRVLTQLLSEMDGVEQRQQVFVIGCTNRPDLIDSAMLRPGRFDSLLFVGPPSLEDRKQILRVLTRDFPCSPNVDFASLAEQTQLFSGADLKALCREACLHASEASADAVSQEHFLAVLQAQRVRATVTQPTLELFENFRSRAVVK